MIFDDMTYNETTKCFVTHKDLVDYVKNIIHEDVYFMIAGGSLVDVQYLRNINDIDVFFTCKEDFDRFNTFMSNSNVKKVIETHNSITYDAIDGNTIQAIQKQFGTPEEILDTFDLNQSKVLIDSHYGYFDHTNTATKELRIIYKNYARDTPQRYIKYLQKGFKTDTNEFNTLLYYMIKNKHTIYKATYDEQETEIPGIHIISAFIHRLLEYKNEEDFMYYIYEELNKNLTQDEMIIVYGSFFNHRNEIRYMYKYSLFIVAIRDEIESKGYKFDEMPMIPTQERMMEVQHEYPEYFI